MMLSTAICGSSWTTDTDVALITVQTPDAAVADLIAVVVVLELARGIENALSAKLEAALNSLANDRPAAIQQLGAFINQVEAMRGNKLTDPEANDLVARAQVIIDAINAAA